MSDNTQYMLTTIDNPFNPFTHWDDWYQWDFAAGYHTPGALARQAITSNDLSEVDQRDALNQAIDEIISENFLGIYTKISEDGKKSVITN